MDKEVLWERRLKICMSSMTGFVLVYAIFILLFSFLSFSFFLYHPSAAYHISNTCSRILSANCLCATYVGTHMCTKAFSLIPEY